MSVQEKCDASETSTPIPVYDAATSLFYLRDGAHRQVWCRVDDGTFYVMFKKDKEEYPITLDMILDVYLLSKRKTE